jgi:signal transduction histidine kinase/phage shock protein PspC (stress-responsive transcriptional regulator)
VSTEVEVSTVDEVAVPAPPRALRRHRSGRAVAGVAGGLAEHLDVNVLWVRAVFALLAGFGGAGVVAYGLLWMFVPQEPEATPRAESSRQRQQAYGLLALGIGFAVLGGLITGSVAGWVAGPLGVAAIGVAIVWREADDAQRRGSGRFGWLWSGSVTGLAWIITGVLLVAAGTILFLLHALNLPAVWFTLLAITVTLLGVGALTVPWWLRLVRDLGEERRKRIRTEERAEIAAHLHDSVLQTLALIQKQSDAPREVLRLARGQERQLRGWLYGPAGYGAGQDDVTLASALEQVAAEVENTFAISVQHVVVGDCPLDERLAAVVQAAREAVVNAAKHAGVAEVSVYAEIEADRVTVFVRDRGSGFDPDSVGADRHGLADSIRGRMDRNGGQVRLRTAPGDGTEVQLEMPRSIAKEPR